MSEGLTKSCSNDYRNDPILKNEVVYETKFWHQSRLQEILGSINTEAFFRLNLFHPSPCEPL